MIIITRIIIIFIIPFNQFDFVIYYFYLIIFYSHFLNDLIHVLTNLLSCQLILDHPTIYSSFSLVIYSRPLIWYNHF